MHLQAGLDSEFPDCGASLVSASPPVSNPVVVTPPAPPVSSPEPVAAAPAPASPVVADDDRLRPTIRIVGTSKARTSGKAADDHVEMTLPDEGASSVPVVARVDNAPAKQEYDHALALYNAHDLDHALEGFSAYINRWPDQPGVESALYWSGEAYLAKGEIVEANDEFERALAGFPQGAKAPDSLLSLGVCQQRLGNQDKAKTYFDRLATISPRATPPAASLDSRRSSKRAG